MFALPCRGSSRACRAAQTQILSVEAASLAEGSPQGKALPMHGSHAPPSRDADNKKGRIAPTFLEFELA
jgi:hypothetical protein